MIQANSSASARWPATLPAHLLRYRDVGLWSGKTVADHARDWAEAAPDAVVFPNEPSQPTYAQLWVRGEALAIGLADLGLVTGDVVSFQIANWVEAAVINLACAIGGFVINPIVPIYRDAEARQMLSDGRARVFFYAGVSRGFDYAAMVARILPDLPDLVRAVPVRGDAVDGFEALVASGMGRTREWARVDPDAVKLLLYTSGTTGRPKGVMHSHNTLGRVNDASYQLWKIKAGDAILMPSPVTHISGYSGALEQPFQSGIRCVLMERWDAQAAVDLIERYGVVNTVAATPFLKELAEVAGARGASLPSLRVFACGGAAIPADLVREANKAFAHPCAFRVFGSSEVPLVTGGVDPELFPELAASTDGMRLDYEVRVEDAEGRALGIDQEGEILARGPAMMLGYAEEAQTREAITEDGYFRTGDLGVVTADGAIVITGRKKDLIIRGGENISAKEIEDVLMRHPGVADAAVVSMPHARLGEGVCAFIVARGEAPEKASLISFVFDSGLAKQKCPEHFEFVGDLPRTPSGKVRKDVLRAEIKQILSGIADL